MIKWIKNIFTIQAPVIIPFEKILLMTDDEIFNHLKNDHLSIQSGNLMVMEMLQRHSMKLNSLEYMIDDLVK